MARKRNNGDVGWYLRVGVSKKPFAYSTKATSDLIAILYEQYGDLRMVYQNIHYDEDAKKIVKHYIDNGIYKTNIEY